MEQLPLDYFKLVKELKFIRSYIMNNNDIPHQFLHSIENCLELVLKLSEMEQEKE